VGGDDVVVAGIVAGHVDGVEGGDPCVGHTQRRLGVAAHDLVGLVADEHAVGHREVGDRTEGGDECRRIAGRAQGDHRRTQPSHHRVGPFAHRRSVPPGGGRPVVRPGEVSSGHRAGCGDDPAGLLGDEEQLVEVQLAGGVVSGAGRKERRHGSVGDFAGRHRLGMAEQARLELAGLAVRSAPHAADDVRGGEADLGDGEVPDDVVARLVARRGVDTEAIGRSEQLAGPPIERRFGAGPWP
jgi:hypothetical protein